MQCRGTGAASGAGWYSFSTAGGKGAGVLLIPVDPGLRRPGFEAV